MAEYIDREKFRKFAMEMTDSNEVKFEYCYPYWQFNKAINEMPAADVAPVKRGKWEYNKDAADWGIGGYVCSVCRNKNNNLPCNRVKTVRVFSGVAYCPNCGAKMEDNER